MPVFLDDKTFGYQNFIVIVGRIIGCIHEFIVLLENLVADVCHDLHNQNNATTIT